MPKEIKEQEKNEDKINLKDCSINQVISLYYIVSAHANRHFNENQEGKRIIRNKLSEIEEELNYRIYGCDPFKLNSKVVIGNDPVKALETLEPQKVEGG